MKTLSTISMLLCASSISINVAAIEIPSTVMKTYQAGLKGDEDANANAINSLQALLEKDKSDSLVMALLGSSETTQAIYLKQPWQKMKSAEKGMAKLERALKLARGQEATNPRVSLQVNTTAGCTFVKVPKMFNRLEQGYEILRGIIASKSFNYMPDSAKVNTYLCAVHGAKGLENNEDMLTYIEKIKAIAPQGPHIGQLEQLTANTED